jgi:hypothetical protein
MAKSLRVRTPSSSTLKELPARTVRFLGAVANSAEIRTLLLQGGYGPEAHAQGQALLGQLCQCDFSQDGRAHAAQSRAAHTELTAWCTAHLPRLRACLRHLHPQDMGLLAQRRSPQRRDALLVVASLLEQLQALEREGCPAVVTLSERGLNGAERTRLAKLVCTAQGLESSARVESHAVRERQRQTLLALYWWYRDWSQSARRFVADRAQLRRLGIAG